MSTIDELLAVVGSLPQDEAEAALRAVLDKETALELLYTWDVWARPEQLEPAGTWRWWLLMTGRRWGKTRTAAEWIRKRVESGRARSIALIAQDPLAARKIMVDKGPSSLRKISRPDFVPVYQPTTKTLTWPNGAVADVLSAEDPDQIRGGSYDTVWIDELAALKNLGEVIDNAEYAMSAADGFGAPPRGVMSTTPRPLKLIRALLANAPIVHVTRGALYDNIANLDPTAVSELRKKYEGTRVGRQELFGDVLIDVEGALWKYEDIEALRVHLRPELSYLCVAVDPAASTGPMSNETGIVAVGRGIDGDGYVLADSSGVLSPNAWGQRAVDLYYQLEANEIVAEVNNGGDMVPTIIANIDPRIPVRKVSAARGKMRRAEPVAQLSENAVDGRTPHAATVKRARMHHVGIHPQLEDQMTTYTGKAGETSPDRLDAMVWGTFAAILDEGAAIDFA